MRKIRELKLQTAYNLNSARGISSDEIILCSGAKNTFCYGNNWRTSTKLFETTIDGYYSKILFKEVLNEYDRIGMLINLFSKTQAIKIRGSKFLGNVKNSKFLSRKNLPGCYIVIAPFASDPQRTWGIDKYVWLILEISKLTNVVVIGSKLEKKLIEKILNPSENIWFEFGTFSLSEIYTLVSFAKVFVGNDSGLSHIAIKTSIPLMILIGGGAFNRYFPIHHLENEQCYFYYYKLDCFSCEWKCHLDKRYCLTNIDKLEILNKIKVLFL
ncbi:MAG: hypothetical protein KF721_07255 [Ignavibacteriaceae bacterium]|nr:hypothetical protein [Ignavibacteriaceae bacterium]